MPLGGGIHDHFSFAMTYAKYITTKDTTDFFVPVNPATVPIHSSTSTTAQTFETIRLYGENCSAFQLYHNGHNYMRKQIIAANSSTFLQELQDTILRIEKVTCLKILTHLR